MERFGVTGEPQIESFKLSNTSLAICIASYEIWESFKVRELVNLLNDDFKNGELKKGFKKLEKEFKRRKIEKKAWGDGFMIMGLGL